MQVFFSRKLPKAGFSEKWLAKNLEKYGTRLISEEGWVREIPQMRKEGWPELTTVGELAGWRVGGLAGWRGAKLLSIFETIAWDFDWLRHSVGSKRLRASPMLEGPGSVSSSAFSVAEFDDEFV
ncbi:MAG: hypothetical protein ACJAQT_003362 [Akkermansiaceae bacterium]